jgi:hypothetical protein
MSNYRRFADTMATETVDTEPSGQVSPFMRLPAEVRLAIYRLALQDTVNVTKATTTESEWPCARARASSNQQESPIRQQA